MPGDKKKRFGILKILGVVVALVLVVIILIPFVINANQFRPEVESRLTSALGREVKLGNLKLSILSGSVAADDIAIADDPRFSRSPFVRAQSLQVGVELIPLIFSKAIHITGIALEKPDITLVRSSSGDWNFSSLGSKPGVAPDKTPRETPTGSTRPDVLISQLKVTNGRITAVHSGGHLKPYVYDNVNITAHDLSFTSVFPFTLTAVLPGGGSMKLEGKAGPIDSEDASLTPLTATLAITRFDVIASGFVEPNAGLAGLIDFQGSLNSDGRQLQSNGQAKIDRLQLVAGGSPAARQVSLEYAVSQDLKNQTGILKDAKVQCGKAVAHLDGSYDMHGDSLALKMKLQGQQMPVQDLEPLLPAAGVVLPKGATLQGGTLSVDLSTEGPIDKLVTSGTVDVSQTRLAGFDLASKLATVASLVGIKSSPVTDIEKFASGIRVAPAGIQVNGLSLIVPALGELSGDGTVSPNQSLDFKMVAKLNTSGGVLGGLTLLAGVKASNEVNVPFFIRGSASNPSFVPDTKGIAGGLLQSTISGGGTKAGDTTKGQSLGGVLRDLLGKKKK
jgi:AsmA protein